jgi:hypothetical protein
MSPIKILALLLILSGGAGLAYGGFSFTKETHEAKIGPLELSVAERQSVAIPPWLGGVAILGGLAMLFMDRRTA